MLDATWPAEEGRGGLRAACLRLGEEAAAAVRRAPACWSSPTPPRTTDAVPVPSLLAVGAVQQRLLREGLATRTSVVADTGEPVDSHQAAVLLGYGADAICPRLTLATAATLGQDPAAAQDRYREALTEGVFKIMSKMGISVLDAYRGAQIFEAVGLDEEVVDLCFAGTPSPLGGIGLDELAADALDRHRAGQAEVAGWRTPAGSSTAPAASTTPPTPRSCRPCTSPSARGRDQGVQARRPPAPAGGQGAGSSATGTSPAWSTSAPGRPARPAPDLPGRPPVPLDEVEPAADIMARFSTAAMSLGSLSPEAHETLAIALNRVGGRSNSGEGGEDPARFGTESSAIKQVASGRFGVTPAYLANAVELQIKMAQGSKPGEGGQLPGHKVSAEIARLRHTQPGVALISPPPHHDIYSIEDLAQLVFDLKQANPEPRCRSSWSPRPGWGRSPPGSSSPWPTWS